MRPAAILANAAGFQVSTVDLFADADTQEHSLASYRSQNYPYDTFSIAKSTNAPCWMYTGCMENCPDLIAELATTKQLLGNDKKAIELCRSSEYLHEVAATGTWNYPDEYCSLADHCSMWISKPEASAAGHDIKVSAEKPLEDPNRIIQPFITGPTYGAVCVSNGTDCRLLGVTRQLRLKHALGAGRFEYSGSVGSVAFPEKIQTVIAEMAQQVSHACGLLGLFGLDFKVLREDVWLLEVNPRFTASMELVQTETNLIQLHINACNKKSIEVRIGSAGSQCFTARGILYAKQDCSYITHGDNRKHMADIPECGTTFDVGQPVCSVYGSASTIIGAVKTMMPRARRVRSELKIR